MSSHVFLVKRGGGRPDGEATCAECGLAKDEGDHRELTQAEKDRAKSIMDTILDAF